jgi:hypothetical protein
MNITLEYAIAAGGILLLLFLTNLLRLALPIIRHVSRKAAKQWLRQDARPGYGFLPVRIQLADFEVSATNEARDELRVGGNTGISPY